MLVWDGVYWCLRVHSCNVYWGLVVLSGLCWGLLAILGVGWLLPGFDGLWGSVVDVGV